MSRKSEWVKIVVADGEMGIHVTMPSNRKIRGGIVMLQEIFGVNAAMRAKADRFADEGYVVAMPDLFWRLQPRVELGYSDEERKKGFGLMQKFDFAKGIADVMATGRWLNQQAGCEGRVATLGFCLGGKLAVVAGANPPLRAAIAFYGVKLDENIALLESYPVPVQVHVGDKDSHIPIEAARKIEAALKQAEDGEVFIYPGAQHGFFNSARSESYDPAASANAAGRAIAFLERVLA